MSNGTRALLAVFASSAVGTGYYLYLTAVPFPPGIVRLVPLAWLATSVVGWVWSVQALRVGDGKRPSVAALALNTPNTGFAVIFLLAAMMGG